MIGVLYSSVRTVIIPINVRIRNLNLTWLLEISPLLYWFNLCDAISPIPGTTRNTGIVNIGFSEYLKEDFNIGNPPTDAMLMKRNMIPINVRQNPIEYTSFVSNTGILLLSLLFKTNLVNMIAPMKNEMNAINMVNCKSLEPGSVARSKKSVNVTKTTSGENISSLRILLFLKMDKKFSLGYKLLK